MEQRKRRQGEARAEAGPLRRGWRWSPHLFSHVWPLTCNILILRQFVPVLLMSEYQWISEKAIRQPILEEERHEQ